MTGYLFATGPCVNCGNLFDFDLELVPSYEGRPICRQCIERINIEREELGMEPVHVYPGAYAPAGKSLLDEELATNVVADYHDPEEDRRLYEQGWHPEEQ